MTAQIARLRQLVKKCKRRAGSPATCPCNRECQAEELAASMLGAADCEIRKLQESVSSIKRLQDDLYRKPCTVRPDWSMPQKPDGDYHPCVYMDEDGCVPHWFSETEKIDYIDFPPGPFSWPFVEELASVEDWERLGFEVA